MHRPTTARANEDDRCVNRREEPEKGVDEINPDGVLHADLTALLRSRVGRDVDVAEDAEESDPEDTANVDVSALGLNIRCVLRGYTHKRTQSQPKAQ